MQILSRNGKRYGTVRANSDYAPKGWYAGPMHTIVDDGNVKTIFYKDECIFFPDAPDHDSQARAEDHAATLSRTEGPQP